MADSTPRESRTMSVIAAMAPFIRCPATRTWPGNARSAQSSLGLGCWRRSTATSWRSTSSSASFAADERASSASHPARRTNIRYSSRTVTRPRSCQPTGYPCWRTPRSATYAPYWNPTPAARREMRSSETRNRSHGGARAAAQIRHPAALIAHQTRTITPARGSNRSGNRCAARAAHLPRSCRPRRVVLLGCRRAGCPAASSWSAMGRCGSVSA